MKAKDMLEREVERMIARATRTPGAKEQKRLTNAINHQSSIALAALNRLEQINKDLESAL